jgi:hypothetical protein
MPIVDCFATSVAVSTTFVIFTDNSSQFSRQFCKMAHNQRPLSQKQREMPAKSHNCHKISQQWPAASDRWPSPSDRWPAPSDRRHAFTEQPCPPGEHCSIASDNQAPNSGRWPADCPRRRRESQSSRGTGKYGRLFWVRASRDEEPVLSHFQGRRLARLTGSPVSSMLSRMAAR